MHIALANFPCDTEICITSLLQLSKMMLLSLFLCFDCLFKMFSAALAKGVQLSPQVEPLDFGWRSCVNVLLVWRLDESNLLPLHNFFH